MRPVAKKGQRKFQIRYGKKPSDVKFFKFRMQKFFVTGTLEKCRKLQIGHLVCDTRRSHRVS